MTYYEETELDDRIRIHGLKINEDQHQYNPLLKEMAMLLISELREGMELPPGSKPGRRFMDDQNVYERLVSWISPAEFSVKPKAWVKQALLDAAAADYWYDHEKDYGLH